MSDAPLTLRHFRLAGWEWALIVLILLGGFALRVARFTEVPPGVIHDEVLDWLNVKMVYSGDIRALYPHGGGREALYMFLLAGTYKTIGINLIAQRLPSLAFSMVGIAALFALAHRLFGRAAGFVAAATFATSYWAISMGRLGERTGSAPVMGLIASYLFVRLLARPNPALRRYIAAGIVLGVTLYTYPAALMFPAILAGWLILIALFRYQSLRSKWIKLGLSFAITGIMVIPLALAWANPTDTARANAVNAPLKALLAGDPGPTLDNVLPVLGVFTVKGDHGLEFNIQDQPIFPTPILGVLFYIGFAAALIGLFKGNPAHRPGYLLILLWLIGMLIPTLVTERPVNPSRTIGLLGVVYLFPAVAVMAVKDAIKGPMHLRWSASVILVAALGIVLQLQHSIVNYFHTWAENPVVRFLYQDEFRQLANDLDSRPDRLPLAIGGLTPDQMDPISMRLLMRDDHYADSSGYFDPQTALLIPAPQMSDTVLIAVPSSITLHPALAQKLSDWQIEPEATFNAYTLYVAHLQSANITPSIASEVDLALPGGSAPLITLIGIDSVGQITPGQSFTMLTFWRAHSASDRPLRIFVHVLAPDGSILAQSDVLGVPATQWRQDDVIVQTHDLTLLPDMPVGSYIVEIGMYDPARGVRLTAILSGVDHVEISLDLTQEP